MQVGIAQRRRSTTLVLVFVIAALLVAVPGSVPRAFAAIINVPADQPTIQAAVDAALPDDEIVVADGAYTENVIIDESVTIRAANPGAVTIDGNTSGSVITVAGAFTVTLDGLRITNGADTTGGGVDLGNDGDVTITDSAIFANVAPGASGRGGGVYLGSSGASLTLDRVSIFGNTSERGGGIYMGGGTLDVRNTTVSNNTASAPLDSGGGLFQQAGTSSILNVTLTGNTAATGAAVSMGASATMSIKNTVAAGNNSASANPDALCTGVTSLGWNFISRVGSTCAGVFTASGDQVGTPADPLDPRLGPIQDNGGVGLSRLPESDSPLIDAGDNTGLDGVLDQLGQSRTIDGDADSLGTVDIGAVELDPLTVCVDGCDHSTIAAAIAAAASGDVIRIGAGTFGEPGLVVTKDLIFQGSGPSTAVDGLGLGRVLLVGAGSVVTMRDFVIQNGLAPASQGGGGVRTFGDLDLERMIVRANANSGTNPGDSGGGIRHDTGTLTVVESRITNNTAGYLGGGLFIRSGTVNIIRSTVDDNTGPIGGGGIAFETTGSTSFLNIVNSTITGNSGGFSLGGGGIYTFAAAPAVGEVYLSNSTISGNQSNGGNGGGGIVVKAQIDLEVANTVIAGNTDTGGLGPDCRDQGPISITSLGHNVIGQGGAIGWCPQFVDGVNGDQVGTSGSPLDPDLNALADNGGPTPTMLPASGSPVVDAGSPLPIASDSSACQLRDQRGVDRPDGAACDVGAVEGSAAGLQALIDSVGAGGVVTVPAGTFVENVTIGGGKTLRGAGSGATVIDGSGAGSTITILPGGAVIEDVTVQNGDGFRGGNIDNQAGAPLTIRNATITGGSAAEGGNVYSGGTLVIENSIISDGSATGSESPGQGSGVFTAGDTIVTNSTFTGNDQNGTWGGALTVDDGTTTITGSNFAGNDGQVGGAIWIDFDAVVDIEAAGSCVAAPATVGAFTPATTFSGNFAAGSGGAIYNEGTLNVHDTLFTGNSDGGIGGAGGAIAAAFGATTVVGCSVFESNTVVLEGGAIATDNSDLAVSRTLFFQNGSGIAGGAIHAAGSDVTSTSSIYDDNSSASGGAVALTTSSTYVGFDNLFRLNDANNDGGAVVATATSFSSTSSIFDSNSAFGFDASGGALLLSTNGSSIVDGLFTANTATGDGGAIESSGPLTVDATTISGNTAGFGGGGISSDGALTLVGSSVSGNTSRQGGGVEAGLGEFRMIGSTVAGNTATSASDTAGAGLQITDGGVIANSTISGNDASAGGGGGLVVLNKPVEVVNTTIVENTASTAFAGAYGEAATIPLVQLRNSVVGLNRADGFFSNCTGTASNGYNVFETSGCGSGPGDQSGGDPIEFQDPLDPRVGPLQDNGGPTETHTLLPGSPAIDNGDPGTGNVLTSAGDDTQSNGSADASLGLLTDDTGQAGSFFGLTPFDPNTPWSVEFAFEIVPVAGLPGETSGDGLTFALTDSPFALGDSGGRLGIGNVFDNVTPGGVPASYNAVSVEFDTFRNGFEQDNEVGINVGTELDLVTTDALASDAAIAAPFAFDDGRTYTAWVDYDPYGRRLEVRIADDGVRPTAAFVALDVDVADVLGGSATAYAGFTAGTGTAAAEHRIIDWTVTERSSCTLVDQRGVPRPEGPACDSGSFEGAGEAPTVIVDLLNPASVATGAQSIATKDLPSTLAIAPTDPTDPTDDNLASAPIANLDTQSAAIESSPIANLPIANLDVAGAPIANLPIANLSPQAQAILDALLLIEVPITGGWEPHLAASPTLAGRPVQNVSYGEALADEDVLQSLADAGLTLNDLNVSSTPIANLPIASLAVGNLPIANLPIANLDNTSQTTEQILQGWCDFLGAATCTSLGIVPAVGDDGGQTLASLAIVGADLSAAPIANLPIANLPIANLDASNPASLPIANLPIANLFLAQSPIANLPIANLPIANLDVLGAPIANLPIANLPIANLAGVENLPIANLPIANLDATSLPIANLYVAGAPIANLPIANLPIANLGPDGLPIANLPIANLPIANLPIANLGDFVNCGIFDCNAAGATVGDAFLAGALLGDVQVWLGFLTIQDLADAGLVITDLAGTVIPIQELIDAFIGVTLLDLAALDMPDGQFANLGQITLGELADLLGLTVGELLIALIVGGSGDDVTLGDVLLLLVAPEDFPWEDIDLDGVDLQALDPDGETAAFTTTVDVANGFGAPAQVTLQLPAGFVYRSATIVDAGAADILFSVVVSDETVVFDIPSLPDGLNTITVEASASLTIGVLGGSVQAEVAGVNDTDTTTITVTESFEDENDAPETAPSIDEDILYLSHVSSDADVDIYKIPGVSAGSRISVNLSDLPDDFELVLYQPDLPALRPGGVTPEGSAGGVTDPGGFVDGDDQIQNEIAGDFPQATLFGEPLRIYETSTQAGTSDEVITTNVLQASGDYYVQVHGQNGVSSLDPYALRVEVVEVAGVLDCTPFVKPFDGEGVAGSTFVPPAGAPNTVILFNQSRFGDFHGAAAAADVRAALETFATQNALGVNAVIVAVDDAGAHPGVAAAYQTWDANRCDPNLANAVAAEIGQLTDELRETYPSVEYITIIGDDTQIPFFRIPDYTEIANESEFAFSVSATNNELVGSLFAGFYLSDDPFGDAHPLIIEGRELYISELPIGRLLETPGQIVQSLDNFGAFGGRLDPGTTSVGLSTGYDFIEDGANAIRDALDLDPRRTTATLNTPPLWDSDDLSAAIDGEDPNVLSLGAHMSFDSLLSAVEDTLGTQADLWTTADVEALGLGVLEGTIIFSMGCHSGLPVSDFTVGAPVADFPATFTDRGGWYAAETGFGYGDTDLVAYGEELMRQFAGRLNGSMTVGQAMSFAKQFHAANLATYSPYDEKVLMETVSYGLPMFAVGDPAVVPPAPPVLPSTTDPRTGLNVVSTGFDFGFPGPDGEFELITAASGRGQYYTAGGDAQVTPFHPVQPRATRDVTQPGEIGTGVLLTAMTSVDESGFDPVFSRPTVDLSANELELSFPGTFPLVLPGLNRYRGPGGERDQLSVMLGQFTSTSADGSTGIQRLFTHVGAQVYYGDTDDITRPNVTKVSAVDNGSVLGFTVMANDVGASGPQLGISRVLVLYKLLGVDGAWTPLDLVHIGDSRWVGAAASPAGPVEYLIQAVDFNGLVATHSNKTAGNVSTSAPAPTPGGVDILIGGLPPAPVYDGSVVIEIVAAPGVPVQVNIDGAGFVPYDPANPPQVAGEGLHTVVATDGTDEETIVFVIDSSAPQIVIGSPLDATLYETTADGVGGFVTVAPLSAAFSCTDAGVGVQGCTAELVGIGSVANGDDLSNLEPGRYTLTVTATDGIHAPAEKSVTFEIAEVLSLDVTPLIVPVGSPVTAMVGFTPDTGHGHTATFEWGAIDGVPVSPPTSCPGPDCDAFVPATGTANASFAYAEPGVYQITVTVDHDGSGSQTVTSEFVVVYDPTGGFVTGGGHFLSPFGAFTPDDDSDPEIGGTAKFAFVSKYKKGSTVPQGNTAFQLVTGEFRFTSTSYDWLVVNGAKAQYAGVGAIEGWNGLYQFKVTLRDADVNDNDSFVDDAFRIRIWQVKMDGSVWVVYDNGLGGPDSDTHGGTQPIDGGSIVIHTPKGGKKS